MVTAGRIVDRRSVASTNSDIMPKMRQDSRADAAWMRGHRLPPANEFVFCSLSYASAPAWWTVRPYLYRAFHALPDLRNKAGEPTGALYGVLNMLRRLESDYKADYKAVVFDAKGKTFRDDWFPEYKPTVRPCRTTWSARSNPFTRRPGRRLALLMVDGVGADDVIGTLAAGRPRRAWKR